MSKEKLKKFIKEHKKEIIFYSISLCLGVGTTYYLSRKSIKYSKQFDEHFLDDAYEMLRDSGGIILEGYFDNGKLISKPLKTAMAISAKNNNQTWFDENFDIQEFDLIIWPRTIGD